MACLTPNNSTPNQSSSNISLDHELKTGENKVHFGAIVGNPPYQKNISNDQANSSLSKQLFPSYVIYTLLLSQNYTSLIIPARWFSGDAQDKSFVKLRAFLKHQNQIAKMHYYEDTRMIFTNVEIKGGICYYLSDHCLNDTIEFVKHSFNTVITAQRSLYLAGLDIILTDQYQCSILQKVKNKQFTPLTQITTGRNAFGIIGKQSVVVQISTAHAFAGGCALRCKANEIRYIRADQVTKNLELFNNFKVFISKSAGAPHTDKKVIGEPYIGLRKTACTDSLIPIGNFASLEEAQHLQTYLKTKFLRYLVALVKSSQNTTQIVYRFVPLQDFTDQSDIDWSQSISEVDEQLFDKYGLSSAEREQIRSAIKDM